MIGSWQMLLSNIKGYIKAVFYEGHLTWNRFILFGYKKKASDCRGTLDSLLKLHPFPPYLVLTSLIPYTLHHLSARDIQYKHYTGVHWCTPSEAKSSAPVVWKYPLLSLSSTSNKSVANKMYLYNMIIVGLLVGVFICCMVRSLYTLSNLSYVINLAPILFIHLYFKLT